MILGCQTNEWKSDNGATPRFAAQLLFITLWDLRNAITDGDVDAINFRWDQACKVLALYMDLCDVSLLV